LAALDRYDADTLPHRAHALIGRPSVHASMISGGTGWSTYPETCTLKIERRTVPGETGESTVAELQLLCDMVRESRPDFRASVSLDLFQPASDLPVTAPLTRALVDAARLESVPQVVEGLSCWTDAALFNAAGIPALCFGPGDIGLAHSAEEWVEVDEITKATAILERVCSTWGR
jgi:acetylornithine deacetylase